jgi:hypothetical protein
MQRGFGAVYLVVGILVLSLVAGAFYLGRQTSSLTESQQVVTLPITQPSASFDTSNQSTIASSLGEISNWKGLQIGLLFFKIPNDWSYREYKFNTPRPGVSYLLSRKLLPGNSDAQPDITISQLPNTTLDNQISDVVKG